MLTFRLLPVAEWGKIVEAGIEPFASRGLPEESDHWRMLVAEEEGRILGVSCLTEVVQNHWFITPGSRRNPAIVQGLWSATQQLLTEAGVGLLYATVSDDQPEVQDMVERLGYVKAPGQLYLLYVPDCLLNEVT